MPSGTPAGTSVVKSHAQTFAFGVTVGCGLGTLMAYKAWCLKDAEKKEYVGAAKVPPACNSGTVTSLSLTAAQYSSGCGGHDGRHRIRGVGVLHKGGHV